MNYLLSIILILCCSSAWAFPPGFVGAITQSNSIVSSGISDNFSTDTSANYTVVTGGLSINSGVAKGSTLYATNTVLHNTSTGSNDHYAQADIELATASGSGVIVGASTPGATSTGYLIVVSATNYAKLYSFSGATLTYTGKYWAIPTISIDTLYPMRVVKTGTSFELYLDTGGGLTSAGTVTDSTYTTGSYVGVGFNQSAGYSPRLDNFEAGL